MSIMHSSVASEVSLAESVAMTLREPKRLFLQGGRIWLTIEGDVRDHFPAVGGAVELPAGRLVVIQGDAEASWHLRPIARPPQSLASHLGLWLRHAHHTLRASARSWA